MSYINSLDTHNGKVGKLGEDFACEFLIGKGHIILERNSKNRIGEIDIITLTETKVSKVHIVEVKTSQSVFVRAEENMNFKKLRKVARLGEIYMKSYNGKNNSKHNNKDSHETNFSIDFIGVYLNKDGSLKKVEYIENLEI